MRRVPLTRRQLGATRGRTAAGMVGIAVGILLILALQGIFAGMEARLTAFVDATEADVVVAQRGVTAMHGSESSLPASVVGQIETLPGVESARSIVFVSTAIRNGKRQAISYLIGESAGPPVPSLVSGRPPRRGEIVLDRGTLRQLDAGVGERVEALGRSWRVSGEVDGTASIMSAVALVDPAELSEVLRAPDTVSFVYVYADGVAPATLARRVEAEVLGVSAATRADFTAAERRVVSDNTTEIVRGMVSVGFVVGLAVAALVAFAMALAQMRDYAVLRALGLSLRGAVRLLLAQVATLVVAAFALALALVLAFAYVAPALSPTLVVEIRAAEVLRTAALVGAMALGAALLPVLRVAHVAPSSAFRR